MDPRTAATKRVPRKDLEPVWNTRTVVIPPLARTKPLVTRPEPPVPSFDAVLESRRAEHAA